MDKDKILPKFFYTVYALILTLDLDILQIDSRVVALN